jgi:hypothetical protein
MNWASVMSGVLVGYWLSNASERRKTLRAHQREIRVIQADYKPSRHLDAVVQLDEWWSLAIDDYGRFKRGRLDKLRARLRAIQAPIPEYDVNCESEFTEEKGARYDQQLKETRERAMEIFERFIATL